MSPPKKGTEQVLDKLKPHMNIQLISVHASLQISAPVIKKSSKRKKESSAHNKSDGTNAPGPRENHFWYLLLFMCLNCNNKRLSLSTMSEKYKLKFNANAKCAQHYLLKILPKNEN